MKRPVKNRAIRRTLTVLVLCLITQLNSFATHIAGAEISYAHVNGNTYKFKLKVYRDCKECKFNNIGGGDNSNNCNEVPALQIKGALGSSYPGMDFGSIEINRISIRDLTPVCNNNISKCRSNSNSQYGFEVHEFEGIFDFTSIINQGYCELDVSIGMSSRNINVNNQRSEQNFFNFAYINLCNGTRNLSTEFTASPQLLRNVNQTTYEALGVKNPDGDSLHFEVKPALVNRSVSVVYPTGRNYNYPFTYACSGPFPCNINLNAPIPEGFYCSESTGDIIFTPISNGQGGVVVVECEEWKKDNQGKYYLAGVTRRDVYSEIITLNNNSPRFRSKLDQMTVCEGESSGIDVPVDDLPAPGQSMDTVYAELLSTLPGATLIVKPLNNAPYRSYSIDLGSTMGYSGTHYLTITLKDVSCPLRAVVSKTIKINVLKSRKVKLDYSVKNCGMLDLASTSTGNSSIYWTVKNIDGQIVRQQYARKLNFQLPSSGKFIVNTYLPAGSGFCELNQTDTIYIKHFQKPVLDLGADQSFCIGTEATIKANSFITYNPYKLYVNNVESTLPYKVNVKSTQVYSVKIIQEDGCITEDNIRIVAFPSLSYKVKRDTICTNAAMPFTLRNYEFNSNVVNKLDVSTDASNVNLQRVDNTKWTASNIKIANNGMKLFSMIKDNNGCVYTDTTQLNVLEPDVIDLKLPESICINSNPLTLPLRDKGVWTCLNKPEVIKGNLLKPDITDMQTLQLVYTENRRCINSKSYEVEMIDTTAILFDHANDLSICEDRQPFELKAYPGGGEWLGPYISNGNFNTSKAVGKTVTINYHYSNAGACASEASFNLTIVKKPGLTVKAKKDKICVGDLLELNAISDDPGPGYWYSDGQGKFINPGNDSSGYQPAESDVKMPFITFIYTVQTNGVCGNISSATQVSVKNGQAGDIVKDYPLSICEPANLVFKSTFKRLEKQLWFINDSLVEEFDYNFNLSTALKAGEYIVKTRVKDSTCEAMAISQTITVLPKPQMKMISNPVQKLSKEYPRLYLKDLSYCKFGHRNIWYFENDSIGDMREINYRIDKEIDTFRIKLVAISGKGGCSDSLTQLFWFTPINQLYIPDAFTPDAKGPSENNNFRVYGPPMKVYYIEIFNRFGEIVYRSNDMNAVWDGTYQGQMCMNGVYFYKIQTEDFEGSSRDYSGTVTLIR